MMQLESEGIPESDTEDDCFAVRQAARYVSQLYDRHLASIGLRTAQFTLMSRLERLGRATTMVELAGVLVMDRTTLVRAIKPLRRDGLLVGRYLEEGRKTLQLDLTGAGREKLQAARKCWYAAQQEFEQRFGIERAAALRHELLVITKG